MDIEKAARELLEHDGIFAVWISPTPEQTLGKADHRQTDTAIDKLLGLCSASVAMHRRVGITGMSRLLLNEDPLGSISVVTNTIDGALISVAVRSGHNVCKSLSRMIKRAIARAKKGARMRMPTSPAEAVA